MRSSVSPLLCDCSSCACTLAASDVVSGTVTPGIPAAAAARFASAARMSLSLFTGAAANGRMCRVSHPRHSRVPVQFHPVSRRPCDLIVSPYRSRSRSERRKRSAHITRLRPCADGSSAYARHAERLRDAGQALWSARPCAPLFCEQMPIADVRHSWLGAKAPASMPRLVPHASTHR